MATSDAVKMTRPAVTRRAEERRKGVRWLTSASCFAPTKPFELERTLGIISTFEALDGVAQKSFVRWCSVGKRRDELPSPTW